MSPDDLAMLAQEPNILERTVNALEGCYHALNAVMRLGYPLDENWPDLADEAYELAGEILWPDPPRWKPPVLPDARPVRVVPGVTVAPHLAPPRAWPEGDDAA